MDTALIAMLTPEVVQQLNANHNEQLRLKGTPREKDFEPVCKIFLPWTCGTFLLTEMDEDGLAFGLADLGSPELGYLSIEEIWSVKGPGGLRAERDIHFRATKPLSQYAKEARSAGRITA